MSAACYLQRAPEVGSHHVVQLRTGCTLCLVVAQVDWWWWRFYQHHAAAPWGRECVPAVPWTVTASSFLPPTSCPSVRLFHEHTLPLILPAYKHVVLLLTRPCGWIWLVNVVPIVRPRLPRSLRFTGSCKFFFIFFIFSSKVHNGQTRVGEKVDTNPVFSTFVHTRELVFVIACVKKNIVLYYPDILIAALILQVFGCFFHWFILLRVQAIEQEKTN